MAPKYPGEVPAIANTRVWKTLGSVCTRLTQSSVFLSKAGIPALYSGVTIITPSYSPNSALKARARSGTPSEASKSPW